jgi:methionine-rich copper-binding protein CopC
MAHGPDTGPAVDERRLLGRVIGMRGLRCLLLCLVVGLATNAGAHGLLDHAEPRPGSRVRTSPTHVSVWFTERLEPAYSRVRVVNDRGERADADDSQVDATDARQLRVSVPPLAAGTYKVLWRVLSVDGHLTEGEFTFQVAP